MKYISLFLICLLTACSFFTTPSKKPTQQKSFTELSNKNPAWIKKALTVDPLKVVEPQITSWIIENGIEIHFLADPELPIINGTLLIPNGIYLAKQQGEALALEALGSLMRSGGAGDNTPEEVDLKLEELAASINVSFGAENASIAFSCLVESLSEVLPLFQDIILNPKIDLLRLENWKKQKIASIRSRKDSPNDIAALTFNQLLNRGTAFEKLSTIKQVEALTRADLLRVHRSYVIPNNSKLVLTGDLTDIEAREIALNYFAKWPISKNFQEKLLDPQPENSKGVYFYEGDYEQSTVNIGQLGVKRFSSKQYAIQVFNDIFGAKGFSSRLTKNIREKNGWAYSTYGGSIEDVIPGKNLIYLQTKAAQTVKAIDEGIRTLVELQTLGANKQEVANVKRNIQNSFVFDYDNNQKIVNRFAILKMLNFPPNYQQDFLKNIDSVSIAQVQDVAKDLWKVDDFIVVVVGPSSTYNLLESAVADPESSLYQYPLKKITFNEQAEF